MSDWYQIESKSLIVQITTKGAEMKRLFSRDWHRELLWLGDNKVWNRSAPILFPIVGKLKDDEYELHGKKYKLAQHGFARDMEFKCVESTAKEVEFLLVASQESFAHYPFCFEVRVRYSVEDSKVKVFYFVKNDDRQDMFFSIWAHPAFDTKDINHYEIRFEKEESEFFRVEQGLVNWKRPQVLSGTSLPINAELFKNDALIFKKLKSRHVDLVDTKKHEMIRITSNSDFFGIWGKDKVPFVCLEPWFGVSDDLETDKKLSTKNGIINLPAGEIFGFSYTIEMKYIGNQT